MKSRDVLGYDVKPSDIRDPASGVLASVVQQICEKWYPDGGPIDGAQVPRCGTAYIGNTADGNGEIRIVLRFPLDMAILHDEHLALLEKAQARLLRCTGLHVVKESEP